MSIEKIIRMCEDLEEDQMVDLMKEIADGLMSAEQLMEVAAHCMGSILSRDMEERVKEFLIYLSPAVIAQLKNQL
jgi:hypothetical protein